MVHKRGPYILTQSAERDFREAKQWSHNRWGSDLTRRYFQDLHAGAMYVADNHEKLRRRDELTAATGLSIYPVREHYIVYIPGGKSSIVIVALLRQGRNIRDILTHNAYRLKREVDVALKSIQSI